MPMKENKTRIQVALPSIESKETVSVNEQQAKVNYVYFFKLRYKGCEAFDSK